jgi:hypothetical protein
MDRLIRITALAVMTVAVVAAVISYQHAFELVRSHGESGMTARLLPFMVDGLIWAASMVVLDASTTAGSVEQGCRDRGHGGRQPGMGWGTARSARWSAPGPRWRWSARSSFLMMLIRTGRGTRASDIKPELRCQPAPLLKHGAPLELPVAPSLEQTVRGRYEAGHSQRAIARELGIHRRKVKRILDHAA